MKCRAETMGIYWPKMLCTRYTRCTRCVGITWNAQATTGTFSTIRDCNENLCWLKKFALLAEKLLCWLKNFALLAELAFLSGVCVAWCRRYANSVRNRFKGVCSVQFACPTDRFPVRSVQFQSWGLNASVQFIQFKSRTIPALHESYIAFQLLSHVASVHEQINWE